MVQPCIVPSQSRQPPEASLPGALRGPVAAAGQTGCGRWEGSASHTWFVPGDAVTARRLGWTVLPCWKGSCGVWGREDPVGSGDWGQLLSRCQDALVRRPGTALSLLPVPLGRPIRLRPCRVASPQRHRPRAASERQAPPWGPDMQRDQDGRLGSPPCPAPLGRRAVTAASPAHVRASARRGPTRSCWPSSTTPTRS